VICNEVDQGASSARRAAGALAGDDALPSRETRIAAGRACRLVASCRASWAVGRAVEQLAKCFGQRAKAVCLKLRELIDCVVVAPRVKVTDPFRSSRAATLMQSDPGRVSVALVPRGGLHQSCEINDLGKSGSIDPSTRSLRFPGKVSHQRADSAARSATRNYPKADFGRMLHSPSEGRCRCLRGKAAKKRTYFQRLCADRVTTRKNPRERCASSAGTRSSIG
jgi:hypothetical protein